MARKKLKLKYNRERLLLIALVAVAFFGFLLWSIQQTSLEEESLINGFESAILPIGNQSIRVVSPKINEAIKSPITISGQAAVFEAVLHARLKDGSGIVLAEQRLMSKEGQKMSPFSAEVKYKKPTRSKGNIEVFTFSPKDGSEINKVVIPVRFKD